MAAPEKGCREMESGITNFRENTQPNGNTKYFLCGDTRGTYKYCKTYKGNESNVQDNRGRW